MGCALDAAARGYEVLLIERGDFGSGTSSRSTKIIHGGIRYLRSFDWSLIRESLEERSRLQELAPHAVRVREFVVPFYSLADSVAYGAGVRLYQRLAPASQLGPFAGVENLSRVDIVDAFPALARRNLRGGVLYRDGQFDDVRLLISIAKSAAELGATILNYCALEEFLYDGQGAVRGARVREVESGAEFEIHARVIINAAGPFSDQVRSLAGDATTRLLPSQGIHLVFGSSVFPATKALVIPKTLDKRVMFLIPWHDVLLVGTTDHTVGRIEADPRPRKFEVNEILSAIAPYLEHIPDRSEIRASFAGLRPLAALGQSGPSHVVSRDFVLDETRGRLLSVRGGKWTTYRKMAMAAVGRAAEIAELPAVACMTATLALHGSSAPHYTGRFEGYGSDASAVEDLESASPNCSTRLVDSRPETVGQVVYAVRNEMARTVEDVLARRLRTLFLDRAAALAQAPHVAKIIATELGRDRAWEEAQLRLVDNAAPAIEKFL